LRDIVSDWLNKDRSETHLNRINPRVWKDNLIVENPALGINIYKGVLNRSLCEEVISVLENNIGNEKYQWAQAHVTESDNPLLNARDCLDFKIISSFFTPLALSYILTHSTSPSPSLFCGRELFDRKL
jgi:hypothetical protein